MNLSYSRWLLLGALSAACSATLSDPGELAEGDPQASGQSTPEGGSNRAQPVTAPPSINSGPVTGTAWLSDASPDAGVQLPDAGTTSNTAPLDERLACIVTGSVNYGSAEVTWRETWDGTTRVHTRYVTAAQDSQVDRAWRYDAQGRVLAYVGVRNSFQHDFRYDEHGNVQDFRLSYPGMPDLFVASSASTWIGTSYSNEYDAQGVLLASTATSYGGGAGSAEPIRNTFEHDDQGRCLRIESKGGRADTIETRGYDAAGRLDTVHLESSRSLAFNFACNASTETYEYDAAGRIEQVTRRCDGGPEAPTLSQRTYVYQSDGSLTIESLVFDTDLSHEIVFEGKKTFAASSTERRSAGCAALDAAIKSADTACRPR
jgi:hypothetical protein